MRLLNGEETQTPLARFVLFIVCLSLVGICIAGVYYIAVELPHQRDQQPPANGALTDCFTQCRSDFSSCLHTCRSDMEVARCEDTLAGCNARCDANYGGTCNACRTSCDNDYSSCLTKPGFTEGDCAGMRDVCKQACPC
jgi:hypothetical protein